MAVAAALVLFAAGCGVEHLSFATPPDTPPSSTTSTTLAPDLTGVAQRGVAGATTTTSVAIGPGAATLNGTVLGPQGPVPGATIEADRIVGSNQAAVEVTAGPDGGWAIPRILGGRYRVRAWQTPTLDLTTPEIFFLGGSQTMSVNLQLSAYTGQQATVAVNPTSAFVGGSVNAVVSVTSQSVDSRGIVTNQPAANVSVSLLADSAVTVSASPQLTGSGGQATFTLTCASAGDASVSATTIGGATTPAGGVACYNVYVPPPITSPPPSAPSTSSSTAPGSSSTGTSTTRPFGVP